MIRPSVAPRIPRIPDPHGDDNSMALIPMALFAVFGVIAGLAIGYWIWG